MWPIPKPTYARKRIDINWWNLVDFLHNVIFQPQTPKESEASLDKLWSPYQTLATFTVRTGFDLFLQACNFPPGSEVIISAVTIPDMARIIVLHDLVPVPVDIQEDGGVLVEHVESLIGSETKALLIAHLFGNRMPFEGLISLARKRGLMVIEDCAEAFCGRDFTGSSGADISMFSFGSIKTSTALGGALLTVRNSSLLPSMRKIEGSYPQQSSRKFLGKAMKYCFFKFLTDNPYVYGSFLKGVEFLRIDHHGLIRKWSRSFHPDNLLAQIRNRPSSPGLQLLQHRISTFQHQWLHERKERIECFASLLPEPSRPVGFGQDFHHHWLVPIRASKPELLIEKLYREGFDAADGGTSLAVVSTGKHPAPERAKSMMGSIVYIPMDHAYDEATLHKLAAIIDQHCAVYR